MRPRRVGNRIAQAVAWHNGPHVPPWWGDLRLFLFTIHTGIDTMSDTQRGGDLYIVDNSDANWKVSSYLSEWCELSNAIDIATGSACSAVIRSPKGSENGGSSIASM